MNERLKDSVLVSAISAVIGDVSDLLQKEIRLAKAELSQILSTKLRAGLWMSITGLLGVLAVVVAIEAAIFAISSYGIALHWSCLIVSAALALAAAGAYGIGSADARTSAAPTRTLRQIRQDATVAKEQLS